MVRPLKQQKRISVLCAIMLILLAVMVSSSGCIKLLQKNTETVSFTDVSPQDTAGMNLNPPPPTATTSSAQPVLVAVMTPAKSEMVKVVAPILTPNPYPVIHGTQINDTPQYNPLDRIPDYETTYHLTGYATGLLVNVAEGPLYVVYQITPKYDCLDNPDSCRGSLDASVNRPYMTITVRDNQTHEILAEDGYAREYSSDTGRYQFSITTTNADGSTETSTTSPGPRYIPIYREGVFHITIEGNYLDVDLSILTGASPNLKEVEIKSVPIAPMPLRTGTSTVPQSVRGNFASTVTTPCPTNTILYLPEVAKISVPTTPPSLLPASNDSANPGNWSGYIQVILVSVVIAGGLATFLKFRKHAGTPKSNPPATTGSQVFSSLIYRIQCAYLRIVCLPRCLGNRTHLDDLSIFASLLVAILTGFVALFIDFPLIVLILIGLCSLSALILTATAVMFRVRPGIFSPSPSSPPVTYSGFTPTQSGRNDKNHSGETMECEFPEPRTSAVLDQYWIEQPYVYIKIIKQGNQGFTYSVVEPVISTRERMVLRETYNYLRDVIIYQNPEKSPTEQLNRDNINGILHEFDSTIPDERLPILFYFLKRDLSGFGPLEPLMRDPALEDISCNGENLPVFVFHRDYGSLPTSVCFHERELDQFVLKLAQKANKQISLSTPMIDATLPGGSRVQVTYSNVVSLRGSSFTIRKFRADPMTPLDLIRFGTYNAEILAFLWLVIEHRRSLIIAGGTASGKTSTMNAISLFIPLNAKIVSLEDTHEIQLPHKNWLATQTRELSISGVSGDIDLFSLLKSSMRQRPEYIIVGEVRGKEAQTLFQAMNTGHATLSTIHAGTVQEAINRLTHEPISVPTVMFTALDIVINQSVYAFGNSRIRRCFAINEITVDNNGTIIPMKLFEWDVRTDTFLKVAQRSRVLEDIALTRGWSKEHLAEELKKRKEFLDIAMDVPTPDIIDLANAIHDLGE